MRRIFNRVVAAACSLLASVSVAVAGAGSWQVVESSGTVRTTLPMSGVQLVSTGETFSAGAVLATGVDGRAVLVRGDQQIIVGPNSRMSLPAIEEKGMTRIVQDLGTLLFKVDKRDQQHFRVETPVIAAVVKGTTFTVTADVTGHAVHVAEGAVEVSARNSNAIQLVTAGMTARVSPGNPGVIEINNGARDASGPTGGALRKAELNKASDLVIPADVGADVLDFAGLSEGLVRPAIGAELGGENISVLRGQNLSAVSVQDARFSIASGARDAVGGVTAGLDGAVNPNGNVSAAIAPIATVSAENGNATAGVNVGDLGGVTADVADNGNATVGIDLGELGGVDVGGNLNSGDSPGGVDIGVNVGDINVDVGLGESGVNAGAGLGGLGLNLGLGQN